MGPLSGVVTNLQMKILVTFMEAHRDLAMGRTHCYVTGPMARQYQNHIWRLIAIKVNNVAGGSAKTSKAWKQYWNSCKHRLHQKIIRLKKIVEWPVVYENLPEIEKRIVKVMGLESKYNNRIKIFIPISKAQEKKINAAKWQLDHPAPPDNINLAEELPTGHTQPRIIRKSLNLRTQKNSQEVIAAEASLTNSPKPSLTTALQSSLPTAPDSSLNTATESSLTTALQSSLSTVSDSSLNTGSESPLTTAVQSPLTIVPESSLTTPESSLTAAPESPTTFASCLDTYCAACLSKDRKLVRCSEDEMDTKLIRLLKQLQIRLHEYCICWECHRILKKIIKFQQQALRAMKLLNNKFLFKKKEANTSIQLTSFSTLGEYTSVGINIKGTSTNSESKNMVDNPKIKDNELDKPEAEVESSKIKTVNINEPAANIENVNKSDINKTKKDVENDIPVIVLNKNQINNIKKNIFVIVNAQNPKTKTAPLSANVFESKETAPANANMFESKETAPPNVNNTTITNKTNSIRVRNDLYTSGDKTLTTNNTDSNTTVSDLKIVNVRSLAYPVVKVTSEPKSVPILNNNLPTSDHLTRKDMIKSKIALTAKSRLANKNTAPINKTKMSLNLTEKDNARKNEPKVASYLSKENTYTLYELKEARIMMTDDVLKISEQIEIDRKHRLYLKAKFKCDKCAFGFHDAELHKIHMLKHNEKNNKIILNQQSTVPQVNSHKNIPVKPLTFNDVFISQMNPKSLLINNNTASPNEPKAGPVMMRDNVLYRRIEYDEMLELREKGKQDKTYIDAEFKCDKCIFGFKDEELFNIHMLRHNEESGAIVCPICCVRFKDVQANESHRLLHLIEFYCQKEGCGFRSRFRSAVKYHRCRDVGTPQQIEPEDSMEEEAKSNEMSVTENAVETRDNLLKPRCEYKLCWKTFDTFQELIVHETEHHKSVVKRRKLLKCADCPKRCRSKETLQMHITEHHEKKLFHCEQCNKSFKNAATYLHHMKLTSIHGTKKYECDYCGMKFVRKFRLSNHIVKTHMQVKNYACSFCGKKCYYKSSIKKHEFNWHTSEKAIMRQMQNKEEEFGRYECALCPRFAKTKGSLRMHILEVHEKKPIHCAECNRNFRTQKAYAVHLQNSIKHVQPRHECDQCDQKFIKKFSLSKHIYMFHMRAKSFACEFCGKLFNSESHRNAHEVKTHGKKEGVKQRRRKLPEGHKNKIFRCEECDKSFNSFNTYYQHMNYSIRHKEPIYKCHYCSRKYVTKFALRYHLVTHVKNKQISMQSDLIVANV